MLTTPRRSGPVVRPTDDERPTRRRSRWLRRRLDAKVRPRPPRAAGPFEAPDGLPDVVDRYLRFMGFDPADRGGDVRVRFHGTFARAGLGWMPATAWGRTSGGRAVPTAASAVWMLDGGPLTSVRGGVDPTSWEVRPAR